MSTRSKQTHTDSVSNSQSVTVGHSRQCKHTRTCTHRRHLFSAIVIEANGKLGKFEMRESRERCQTDNRTPKSSISSSSRAGQLSGQRSKTKVLSLRYKKSVCLRLFVSHLKVDDAEGRKSQSASLHFLLLLLPLVHTHTSSRESVMFAGRKSLRALCDSHACPLNYCSFL